MLGIDVSLEQSSVCVVDGSGKIVWEAKVASEPEVLAAALLDLSCRSPVLGWKPGRCRSGCTPG